MALEPLGIQALAAGVPNFVRDLGSMDKAIGRVGSAGDSLGRQFVGLGNTVIKVGGILGTALVGAATAATGALAAVAAIGIREAVDAEKNVAALQSVLAATGGVAGITEQRALDLAMSLRDLAGGSDDAVIAAEAVLLRFKNIRGDAFEPALRLTLDLAAALGTDAASAAGQLGRALELPGEGLRALRLAGIILTDEQQKLIDGMVETGRIAEAQTFLMDALSTSIGGRAVAASKTLSGQFTILIGHIREQAESIGFVLIPSLGKLLQGLTPLVEQVLPLMVELFRSRIGPAIDRAVGFILRLAQALVDAGPLSIEFREALLSMLPQDLQDRIREFGDKVVGVFTQVRDFITENKDAIIGAIEGIGAALAAAAVVATIAQIAGILGRLTSPIGLLLTLIGLLKAGWDTNFMGMRDTLTNFWETTGKPIFDTLVTWLQDNLPRAIQTVSDLFSGEFAPALGEAGGFLQPIIDGVKELVDAFMLHVPSLVEEGQRFASFFSETLGPTVQRIVENIGIFLQALATFWREHGDEVIDVVGFLVRTVLATFEGFATLVTGIIAGLAALLTGDFEGAVQAITNGLEGLLEAATNVVGVKLDDFLDMWSGILDNLSIIISAALQGISDGIATWVQGVSDSIVGGLEGAIDAVADFLGLGSPSKLMMGIGQQMMEGLAAGIRGSTPMPAIALQTAAAQVVGAGPSSTTNLNLTVNSASRSEPIIGDFQMMQAMAEKI